MIEHKENINSMKVGKIPIANIWLLMLYASDYYRSFGKRFSSVDEIPDDIPDLIAKMLCSEVKKKLRRNLTLGYIENSDSLSRLRGKIDVLETKSKNLLSKGKVACSFTEITVDTPRNCFIRSALEKFSKLVTDNNTRKECLTYSRVMRMQGVEGPKPRDFNVNREVYGRHDSEDRQIVFLAKLAFDLALPSEMAGNYFLQAPSRNEVFLRSVFEKGVAGFYRHSFYGNGIEVRAGKKLNWQIDEKSVGVDSILPTMKTDIEIENESHHVVIDTKFNSILTKGWHRDESLRSGYIYQLYSYLRSQEKAESKKSLSSIGILLHPSIGRSVDEKVQIQGHWIRFCTIDLTGRAKDVTQSLRNIVSEYFAAH